MKSAWRTRSGAALALAYGFLIVLKLWLAGSMPVRAIPSQHDDYLFVRQAVSLLDGGWLGPFDHLILSKGAFFPIWLALTSTLHLPYVLALQGMYLLACSVFVAAIRPFQLRRRSQILLFGMLWFSPSSYIPADFRVERSALYTSLTLLTFACAVGLTLRVSAGARASLVRAAGLGLSFGAFWMTREEGLWLLPTLSIVFVASAICARPLDRAKGNRILGCWLFSGLAACCLLVVVSFANFHEYGRFMLVQGRDSAFAGAYRAITRVGDDSPRMMVPMSHTAVAKAASVSPLFAEIEPFLTKSQPLWRAYAKNAWIPLYPEGQVKQSLTDDEEAIGGYFFWQFLSAVEEAGYYRTANAAHQYFVRLTNEIQTACDSGKIVCRATGEDVIPGWKAISPRSFVDSLQRALAASFVLPAFSPWSACDKLTSAVTRDFQRITRSEIVCDTLTPGSSVTPVPASFIGKVPANLLILASGSYRYSVPTLGGVCLLFALLDPRRFLHRRMVPLVLAIACIVGVLVRAVLLAWVDVVTFPSVDPRYTHSSYALFLAAVGFLAILGLTPVNGERSDEA